MLDIFKKLESRKDGESWDSSSCIGFVYDSFNVICIFFRVVVFNLKCRNGKVVVYY